MTLIRTKGRAVLLALALVGALAAGLGPASVAHSAAVPPAMRTAELFPPISIPTRHAAMMVGWYLSVKPRALIGRPATAAKTLAQFEWFTQRLLTYDQTSVPAVRLIDMRAARTLLRNQLGMRQDATPAQAVAALWALAQAIGFGDDARAQAVLEGGIFTANAATVRQRLANLRVDREVELAVSRTIEEAFGRNRHQQ